jgi:hypothetical protein
LRASLTPGGRRGIHGTILSTVVQAVSDYCSRPTGLAGGLQNGNQRRELGVRKLFRGSRQGRHTLGGVGKNHWKRAQIPSCTHPISFRTAPLEVAQSGSLVRRRTGGEQGGECTRGLVSPYSREGDFSSSPSTRDSSPPRGASGSPTPRMGSEETELEALCRTWNSRYPYPT